MTEPVGEPAGERTSMDNEAAPARPAGEGPTEAVASQQAVAQGAPSTPIPYSPMVPMPPVPGMAPMPYAPPPGYPPAPFPPPDPRLYGYVWPGGIAPQSELAAQQQGGHGAGRGWVAPTVAVLITIVLVFGALDLVKVLAPPAGITSRPLIIQVNGGDTTSADRAVLKVTPQTVNLGCHGTGAFTLHNSGERPLSWSIDAIPDGMLLDQRSPHSGTLAPDADITVTLVALGNSQTGTLRLTDDLGETLAVAVAVRCP